MNLISQSKSFIDSERQVKFQKQIGEYKIDMKIFILSDKFIEYQKDIFNEFASSLNEIATSGDVKRNLEKGLQTLNTNLGVFANKINPDERFQIKGFIQMISGVQYLCSIIGQTSTIIFRQNKINTVLMNEIDTKTKIDTFSEFIEGELEPADKIVILGMSVLDYITQNELNDLVNVSKDGTNPLDLLIKGIAIRTSEQEIGFAHYEDIEAAKIPGIKNLDNSEKFKNILAQKTEKIGNFVLKNKYAVGGGFLILFIIIFLYTIVNNINAKNQIGFIQSGDQTIQFNLDINDLRKDIALLAAMPNGEEKQAKYKEIMQKIEVFEKKGKQKYDIEKIKQDLNSNYYQMFNINLVTSLQNIGAKTILSLTSNEKNIIGSGGKIFFSNSVDVIGSSGAILGITNDSMRGKSLSYGSDLQNQPIQGAIPNILGNGYYIFTNNSIYNLANGKFASLPPKNTTFPTDIIGIGKYKTFVYILSKQNLLAGNILQKYQSVQDGLGQPTNYTYSGANLDPVSDFVVDGSSFLIWSNADKQIHQFIRKDPASPALSGRIITRKGENSILPLGDDIKILSSPSSDYMMIFDNTNDTLSVYKTNIKKTDQNFDYTLDYQYEIKFDIGVDIKDINVTFENEKSNAYILTNDGIYQLPLQQFFK